MEQFPSPQAVLAATSATLKAAGLPKAACLALRENPSSPDWESDCRWLQPPDHHLMALPDSSYPERLAQIPDPPPLLYIEGCPDILDTGPMLALVGTRRPTRSGERTAQAFARDLAKAGFIIVSGLAQGIDAASHRGALEASGKTVAVQGCGPDRTYPPEHSELARKIAEAGALVTEFPTGTPPRGSHFPRRNRIVSGLALGVLVVEAGNRSGALITAHYAGQQGREVWAVPGSIYSSLSRGPHRLIREGAKLVENLIDIIEELPQMTLKGAGSYDASEPLSHGEPTPFLSGLTEDQEEVARCVDPDPTALEQVVARSGLTPDRVSAILLELEIRGVIVAEPGGFFTRLPEQGTRGS